MKFIATLENNITYLFIFLVFFRSINALLINTFFDPDEYWQSLEVAHKMVFGYGQMTWEWKEMIRSFLHPLIFAIPFKILELLHLDSTNLIIIVPKLVQGFITAIGDVYLYRLSIQLFNKQVAKWTLICHLISWYTFVCLVRTYSNSIETILFIISLYYWPLPEKSKTSNQTDNIKISIGLTTVAFLIRPTTAIMWLYLIPNYIFHLYKSKVSIINIIKLFIKLLFVSITVIICNIIIDYYFYGKLTFVPYNFLYFNVIKSVSKFYGTHPFHWYFTQGFPTIAFTNILFFVLSYRYLFRNPTEKSKLNLANMTIFSIFLYSFLAHKEFRFIFPILPMVMIYSGQYISLYFSSNEKQLKDNLHQSSAFKFNNLFKKLIIFMLLLNIPMIIFFSNVHQRSSIDIMHYINRNINNNNNNQTSIHFLMSCHATPYQSYIHNPNIHLKILECPPPLNENDPVDEKTLFFENPLSWMKDNYQLKYNNQKYAKGNLTLPDYFIVRDDLIETLQSLLNENGYQLEHEFKTILDITSSNIYKKIN